MSAPPDFAASAAVSVNGVVPLAATAMRQSEDWIRQRFDRGAGGSRVVLVGALHAGSERKPFRQQEDEPLRRPAEGRAKLHSIERRLPAGGAGAGIDQAPSLAQPVGNGARRGRDRRQRRTHRLDRPRLAFPKGGENFVVAPGVDTAIARVDGLSSAHGRMSFCLLCQSPW